MRGSNILLAKKWILYYSIYKKILDCTCRIFPTLLIISISLITFQSNAFANEKFKQAQEYRNIGFEEQEKGNFDKALQSYTKSLALLPDNAVIYNDMGVLYEQLNLMTQAEDHYLRAIQVQNDYLPPYMNLAYLYERQGDVDRAVKFFEKRANLGVKSDPWTRKAKDEIERLDPQREERERQLKIERAQNLEDELLKEAHDDFYLQVVRSEGHYKKGIELIEQQAFNEAVVEFDRALALTPKNPKVTRAREDALQEELKQEVRGLSQEAMRYLELGDNDSAKQEFRKILTKIPNRSNQESE